MDPESKPETLPKKPGRRIAVAALALGLAAAGAFYVLRKPPGPGTSAPLQQTLQLKERPSSPEHVLPGDVDHGRRLYAIHCTSCHGVKGDGFGPAASYLWPAPRDHTEAVYMSSRTDADLYAAIADGGKAVSRSPLMPAWKDRFDSFDIWNLVAFIRTLHPSPDESGLRVTDHEVVLAEERLKAAGGPENLHRVDFNRLQNEDDDVRSIAAYEWIETSAGRLRLSLLFTPEGSLRRVSTHRLVLLPGRAEGAFDEWLSRWAKDVPPVTGFEDLCSRVRTAVERSSARLRAALAQERGDIAEARAVYDKFDKSRSSLPTGQRLYVQNCASCHGTTGRVVGPWIVERGFRPRNHADGSYMGLLSDEYLTSVTRYGGLYWNLSSAMPAQTSLKEDEIKAIVEFMRSLAVPPTKDRCPCSVMAARCMEPVKDKDGGCCCRDGHGTGSLCTHMKR